MLKKNGEFPKTADGFKRANEGLAESININDLLNPPTSKGENSADKLAKHQEDIAKRLSETRISLIDDEYEKERQTAQKKYEENIASIKGNSEEENELRKNYEQILQDELLAIDKNYLDKKMKKKEKGLKALRKIRWIAQRIHMLLNPLRAREICKEISSSRPNYMKRHNH